MTKGSGSIPIWFWLLVTITAILGVVFCVLLFRVAGTAVEQVQTYQAQRSIEATTTAEALVNSTPTATPEIAAIVETDSLWPIVLFDSFVANENDWYSGKLDDELASLNFTIAGGKYRWRVLAHRDVHWRVWPRVDPVSDFYLTVEGQKISGPEDSNYGLVFRLTDNDNFYYFGIDDARFICLVLDNGEWTTLIDWTTSTAIKPREANRLTVIGEGTHLIFLINDQYVAVAQNNRFGHGKVGLAIELNRAGDEGVFEFDNFELRAP